MALLKIKNAYTGRWTSKVHEIDIKYNEKVWTFVADLDTQDDTFVSFYDKADGASILLRIEFLEDADLYSNQELENELAHGLYQADESLQCIGNGEVIIGKKSFNYIDYSFNNKLLGSQLVRHAYFKMDDYVVIFCASWGSSCEVVEAVNFPRKHMAFLNGLKL